MRFEQYINEQYTVKTLYDKPENKKEFSKVFRQIDTSNKWVVNFGVSDGVYAFSKNGEVQGYIQFAKVNGDTLSMSMDTKKGSKKKAVVLSLVKELMKQLKNIKGLKKFKSEFATEEGKKAGEMIAKKLGLELIQHKHGY